MISKSIKMFDIYLCTLSSLANIEQLLELRENLIAGRFLDAKKYEATPSTTLVRTEFDVTPSYNFMVGSLKLKSVRFSG